MNDLDNVFRMDNRVALVTGASSGLGAHFARVLSQVGATVVLCARREERIRLLAEQLQQEGGQALAVVMDVSKPNSVSSAFDQIERQLGTITVLINNAGVACPGLFVDGTEDDWDYVMDTNLKAVWRVAKEAANRMRAANSRGSIVNVASMLGLHTSNQQTLYATSKAGVIHMTRQMAMELTRDNIRVNALCPGYFATEMNEDFFETEKGKAYLQRIPPRRLGQLDELSVPLLMLASEAGSYVNGISLPVDGGHLCKSL